MTIRSVRASTALTAHRQGDPAWIFACSCEDTEPLQILSQNSIITYNMMNLLLRTKEGDVPLWLSGVPSAGPPLPGSPLPHGCRTLPPDGAFFP